jgi:superfamily II DNA or RNA helicase
MKAIITNKFTVLQNPSQTVLRSLKELMSYEDKSVKYQLRRMEKNPFQRNSGYYKKLQKEVKGSLLRDMNGHAAFNSGLAYLIEDKVEIEDRRKDTGKKISFPWKKKPFDPRPYQEEAIEVCMNNWRGIVNFATGMGKTLTAVHLIRKLGRKTLIVVPSDSIARQFHAELCEAFGDSRVGFYGGGKKKIKDITVGIAASVIKATDTFKEEDLGCIIFDEVHHIAASTFFTIASDLGDVGRIYGLTATDYRSDGKDIMINAGCGRVLIKRDIKWGIDHGFLAKPKFIVREVPTTGIDYKNNKLKAYKEHVLGDTVMKAQILADIQQAIANGKSVLCLVDEIAHGAELSKQTGLPFAQGKDKNSNKYVQELNDGTIKGLIGTDGRIGEGTDTKRVDVLILANFVASKGPVIQAIGRGLRIYGSKTECIVLDYIPQGSTMLKRHAQGRVKFYKEITGDVAVI